MAKNINHHFTLCMDGWQVDDVPCFVKVKGLLIFANFVLVIAEKYSTFGFKEHHVYYEHIIVMVHYIFEQNFLLRIHLASIIL